MKKRSKSYLPGMKPLAPVLVTRTINQTKLETLERMTVNAFTQGHAQKKDFDILMEMMNVLLVAGHSSNERTYAKEYVEQKIRPVMESIKSRYDRTGKLGVTMPEKRQLIEFVDFNDYFWIRQPAELFITCEREVLKFYAELAAKRKEAA